MFVADKDAGVDFFIVYRKSFSWNRIIFHVSIYTNYLKLFGIVFVKESNRNAHHARIVTGYVGSFAYLNGIIAVIVRIVIGSVTAD